MTEVPSDPVVYLAPPMPSFWKWDEDGHIVTWVHGETIVFQPELEHVLTSLCNDGLPPLSLVLLVLAACRDSWKDALACSDNLTHLVAALGNPDISDQKNLLDALMRVSRMPCERRHPIEAKVGLIQFLFETATPRTSPTHAQAISERLYLAGSVLTTGLRRLPQRGIREGLKTLLEALGRFDEETFALRQATGLDRLLEPAVIEPQLGEQARTLISTLREDRQFQGLARLARRLMAVVHVPRPLSEPEDLPMGGFSDIANRGPLDRLLVSELAHDNLTLAVRVALNEALYLRRESPPKTPPHARAILIDAGIRLWGVPRLFATAAAMAIAAMADQHTGVFTFRSKGDRIEPVDLTTRHGLVEHLAALEPDAHPGPALDRFLATVHTNKADADRIIVTSADTAADRDFQQSLARHGGSGVYLATVDRTGEFQLLREGPHARKLVCEAKLALEDLLQPSRRPTVPLVDGDRDQRLPAIFWEETFPLRVPHNSFKSWRSWTVLECGVFEIAAGRRLLLWDELGFGPRQIADCVPSKAHVAWNEPKLRDGKALAVLGRSEDASIRLLSVDVASENTELMDMELDATWYSISGYGGFIFAMCHRETRILNSANGRCIDSIDVDKLSGPKIRISHARGRFFRDLNTNVWYALTYDGRRAHFEKVFDPQTHERIELATMFDWIGHEGPVAVTKQGGLYFPDEKRAHRLIDESGGPIRITEVSPCGGWLGIADDGSRSGRYVEVATGRTVRDPSGMKSLQGRKCVRRLHGQLHRNFTGVLASVELGPALVSRKGWLWRIQLEGGQLMLRQGTTSAGTVHAQLCRFNRQVYLRNCGYGLSCGTWADGSQAFLDTRCLLHLRSADTGIPEVSLVLTDAEIAGWCSDGRVWGNRYFVGDRANASPREVFEEVIQPFVKHLL